MDLSISIAELSFGSEKEKAPQMGGEEPREEAPGHSPQMDNQQWPAADCCDGGGVKFRPFATLQRPTAEKTKVRISIKRNSG
jgi:hypothetical protein